MKRLPEFVIALEVTRDGCESDDVGVFEKAIEISVRLKESKSKKDFSTLDRCVSDSLPWSEEIMRSWEVFRREWN